MSVRDKTYRFHEFDREINILMGFCLILFLLTDHEVLGVNFGLVLIVCLLLTFYKILKQGRQKGNMLGFIFIVIFGTHVLSFLFFLLGTTSPLLLWYFSISFVFWLLCFIEVVTEDRDWFLRAGAVVVVLSLLFLDYSLIVTPLTFLTGPPLVLFHLFMNAGVFSIICAILYYNVHESWRLGVRISSSACFFFMIITILAVY